MEVYLTLDFVLRTVYIAAFGFAGWWFGQIIGAIIIRETPTREHALNLLCDVLLALSCSIILCLCY